MTSHSILDSPSTRNEMINDIESPSLIPSYHQGNNLEFQLSNIPGKAETKKSNKPAHDIYGSKPKKKVQITQDQGLDVSFRKEFQAIRSQNVQRSKQPI